MNVNEGMYKKLSLFLMTFNLLMKNIASENIIIFNWWGKEKLNCNFLLKIFQKTFPR